MITIGSEREYRRIEDCWHEYNDVLMAAAESYIRNAYKEMAVRSTEFEALKQGIEIPARIQAITEFMEFLQQAHV